MPDSTKWPGIPTVYDDRILAPAVRVLIEIVGRLVGQRGDGTQAVPPNLKATLDDLERRVAKLENP